GRAGALAFRIEEEGRSVVYASDAGYPAEGPPPASLALYENADVLIHDSTYTPEDRRRYPDRGLSSIEEAVAVAVRAAVKTLVLFPYDQDSSDSDGDDALTRARKFLDEQGGAAIKLVAASEGASLP